MIPEVRPVLSGGARPLWSVMVPTYQPGRHLEGTLKSVLAQDPGPEEMQIEVVDDRSNADVAEMVTAIGKGRVAFRQNAVRQGLFGNWNACIHAARGRYVHILHQDDVVLDGFYAAMGQGLDDNPEAGASFCRHIYIDEDGLWVLLSAIEQRHAGILANWRSRFVSGISLQCPAVVVRRSTYEALGGFDAGFGYSGDAEMWLRIASRMPICHEPRVLACWRMHRKSASTHLIAGGQDVRDAFSILRLLPKYFPDHQKEISVRKAKFLGWLRERVTLLAMDGNVEEALRQTRQLWSLDRRSWRTLKVVVRLIMIIAWASVGWKRTRVHSP